MSELQNVARRLGNEPAPRDLFHCDECGGSVAGVSASISRNTGLTDVEVFCHGESERLELGREAQFPVHVFKGKGADGVYIGLKRGG